MRQHRLESEAGSTGIGQQGTERRLVVVVQALQLFEAARRIGSGRLVLGDAVADGPRIGLTHGNAAVVADADVPALVHLAGAALPARTPHAVGQSSVEGGFRRLARHRNRIELHVDGGQRRFDEERHQEQEYEQTEDGQQQEERRQSKFDVLSHRVLFLLFLIRIASHLYQSPSPPLLLWPSSRPLF